jgi:hypothetical protein
MARLTEPTASWLRDTMITFFILALCGCAVFGGGRRSEESSNAAGMAVLDCEIRNRDLDEVFMKALTLGKGNPNYRPNAGYVSRIAREESSSAEPSGEHVYKGRAPHLIKGKLVSGFLVFHGLAPGTYRLERIEQEMGRYEERKEGSKAYETESWQEANIFDFVHEADRPCTFEVVAGRVTYVGRLGITGTCHQSNRYLAWSANSCKGFWTYELASDRRREVGALQKVRKHYRNTPWVEIVDVRLSALQSTSLADSAAADSTHPREEARRRGVGISIGGK